MSWNKTRIRYWDKESKPLTVLQWGRLFEDPAYRRIGHTEIDDFGFVSTIWIGLDHDFTSGLLDPHKPPLIFETMSFEHGDGNGIGQIRYRTLEAAQRGHAREVERVRALAAKSRVAAAEALTKA